MADEPPPSEATAHEQLSLAISDTFRMGNRIEALLVQQVLHQFDVVLLNEHAEGRAVPEGGACERAFEMHITTLMPVSRWVAGRLLSCGLFLRRRMPATWGRFLDGECSQQQAFAVADATGGLSEEQIGLFDAVAAALVGTMTTSHLKVELERIRDAMAPDSAIVRARAAASQRGVSARPMPDGMGQLILDLTALDTAAVHGGLHKAAVAAHGRAGETRSLGVLMADIAVDILLRGLFSGAVDDVTAPAADQAEPGTLGNPNYPFERAGNPSVPGRAPVQAEVMVIVPAETATGQTDRPAELAGFGPMDAETARHVVQCSLTWTRVLTDPVEDAIIGIDAHKRYIDKGLRRLIAVRQPTCACGCNRPTHRADLDHVWRFEFDGRTRHTNLQGLCRTAHIMKDEGYLDVRLVDGEVRWHTRWGGTRVSKPMFKVAVPVDPNAGSDDVPF